MTINSKRELKRKEKNLGASFISPGKSKNCEDSSDSSISEMDEAVEELRSSSDCDTNSDMGIAIDRIKTIAPFGRTKQFRKDT